MKVAIVVTGRDNGNRTYTAYTKDGNPVHKITVGDHGHGGSIAHTHFHQQGYRQSFSTWAYDIARKYGV